jgi:hypothetical protein
VDPFLLFEDFIKGVDISRLHFTKSRLHITKSRLLTQMGKPVVNSTR